MAVLTRDQADNASAVDDPLLPWLRSIAKAMGDLDSPNHTDLEELVANCIRTFKDDDRYRNDHRFLRIWFLHMDSSPDSESIFREMDKYRICRYSSLLYESYALFLEHDGNLIDAHLVYQLGISRNAEPLERLKKMEALFRDRLSEIVKLCSPVEVVPWTSAPEPTPTSIEVHSPEPSTLPSSLDLPIALQKECCGDPNVEQQTNQPDFEVDRCGRRKRKSRKKKVGNTSDPEVVVPLSFHSRGSSRRRVNCGNAITGQPAKLDTAIFQRYLEYLWRSLSEEKRKSIEYIDCLWFSMYTMEGSKAKVLNWIKRKHIFSKKYVFVPIVQWCHWSLLIFCHFGESPQSETGTPCMLLLDSLQMANPKRLEPDIRKFVLDIYRAEERPEKKGPIYRIPLLVPKVPQQRNRVECGTFVLYYMKLFIDSAPENFSISRGYPYFMKEDWFTLQGLECFTENLETFCKGNPQTPIDI